MEKTPPEGTLHPLRFKDAVGRKYSFPFDMVQTWAGMEELIKQAFLQVDVLGPHVQEGHYDLIGPDGEIILPQVWERLVQPDWAVTMTMWPMDKLPPLGPQQPHMRHGAPPPPQNFWPGGQPPTTSGIPPPGFRPSGQHPTTSGLPQWLNGERPRDQTRKQTRPTMPGMMPPPGWRGAGPHPPPHIINLAPPKPSKSSKKKQDSNWVSFLSGKPSKKKSSKKDPPPPHSPSAKTDSSVSSRVPSTVGPARRPQPKFGGGPFQSSRKSRAQDEEDVISRSEHSDYTSETSDPQRKARIDAREQGLIIVTRSETQGHRVIRHPTFPILEKNPLPIDRQAFSAARLYQDEVSEGTVCLELTKSGSGITNNFASNDADHMRWLNVTRNVLDLNEFENIALNREDLAVNQDVRLAMESIFKTLQDKKLGKSRNTWYIKTGTVIRCDVDSDGKTKASALFVSIPQLQADSFNRTTNVQLRKGICLPRRLHETFHPYDTSLTRDKNQLFRSHEGAQSDEVLWIGDTWSAVRDQLSIIEDDDSILDFELLITGGEAVTAKSWSRLVQKPEQSVIKLVVEWVVPDGSESDRDSIKSTVQDDEMPPPFPGEFETDKQDAASKGSILRFKYLNMTPDGIKCPDCNSQKIYDNIESAIDHLRKRHCAGSTLGTRLVEYLTPLSEAKDSRLREECSEVLRTCRDTMVSITRRLRDIQDTMVFDGQFQKPAQVPMLLDEMYWFYNYEVDEQKLGNLVLDGKIRAKYQLIKDIGRAAETFTKDAERALVSSTHSNSKRKEDVVKFFTSVGPHCVATQIICNLLRRPIQNNASAAELYQAYCTDYGSQVFRHPSKRQIPAIGAIADELARLRTVTEWQQKLVSSLRTVLSPETHLESTKGMRDKMFAIEDYILDKTDEELQEQFDMISSSLDQCKDLIESVNELMEIMSDDHNRAILVFTVVTVVFLPMSFIATYLSMNGGPSEAHWAGQMQIESTKKRLSQDLVIGVSTDESEGSEEAFLDPSTNAELYMMAS
ncbi:hypothetical protein G7Z17_g6360 [Cylindrodendrum hubeiense]|uniref:Ubiquitin-like domain-containing protein n=1 Tax=Cylindrodendrum hubeiense TaxID=595255 RepID=A0A9P5HA22_9HYPO|nr:hypothetical protein G7Z17_g6360 [Cylindrodendrum hubeiense]